MVDYTTKSSSGSSIWLYAGAIFIVLVLLYALFAGGGTTTAPTTLDPEAAITPVEPEPAPAAPAASN